MEREAVLVEAREAKAAGAGRFCMGAAWKGVREGEAKFEFGNSTSSTNSSTNPYFTHRSPYLVSVSNSEDKVAANALINLVRPTASPTTLGSIGLGLVPNSSSLGNAEIGASSMFESMIRKSLTPTLDSLADAAISSV